MKKLTIILFILLIAGCGVKEKSKDLGVELPKIEISNIQDDKIKEIEAWSLNKPKTDAEWAKDTKAENFDVKYKYQLEQMKSNLTEKLPRIQKELDEMTMFPDYLKYQMRDRFKDQGLTEEQITAEVERLYQGDLVNKQWDASKIIQSLERLNKEIELRDKGYLIPSKLEDGTPNELLGGAVDEDRIRNILGTTYYIDFTNPTPGAGTATSTAFTSLDAFTEVARSAGDIAYVRRGRASTTNVTDLNFTSDGTIASPIQIVADYSDLWNDFASSSQTYTLTVGSTTIQASATITDQMFTDGFGKWIFVDGDDKYSYAYEVMSTTTDAITLYLPYKGDNAGSGKTLNIMPYAPTWNTAAGDFQWNFDTDEYWKIQGLQIRGTDANGQVEIDSSTGHEFKDCIFTGNDTTSFGIELTDDSSIANIYKSRTKDETIGIYLVTGDVYGVVKIYDSIIQADGNASIAAAVSEKLDLNVFNSSIGDADSTYGVSFGNGAVSQMSLKSLNSIFTGSSNKVSLFGGILTANFYSEDHNNIIGDNRFAYSADTDGTDSFILLSTTTASLIRSGGGNSSIEVKPTTNFNTNWDFGSIKLFEYPIQADTSNKTYTVYFMSPSDTWTVNPTASELWIECEYWNYDVTPARKIKKSTGTVDFNGSTAWQSLSVTCQPTTAGVLYLRGYYAKTKEAGTNLFYVDVAPVISTP